MIKEIYYRDPQTILTKSLNILKNKLSTIQDIPVFIKTGDPFNISINHIIINVLTNNNIKSLNNGIFNVNVYTNPLIINNNGIATPIQNELENNRICSEVKNKLEELNQEEIINFQITSEYPYMFEKPFYMTNFRIQYTFSNY